MIAVLKLLTIAVLAVLIAGGLLVFTSLGDEPLAGLFPVGNPEPVDFATLQLTDKPNQYLLCPPDLCVAQAHAKSPVYAMSAEALHARWDEIVATQPQVEVLERDRTNQQIDYVQRTARFRFPDVITVRFIPLPENQSTIAIYSRSVFGKSDFGVNKERVEAWVGELGEGR